MTLGLTTTADLTFLNVMAAEVSAAFAVRPIALWNTGVVSVMADMPVGLVVGQPLSAQDYLPKTIVVPYANPIGQFQKIAVDGDEAQPEKITYTSETANIDHFALGTELTYWARRGQVGAAAEAAAQLRTRMVEKLDAESIAVARVSAGYGYVLDVYSNTTPVLFDRKLYLQGIQLFGDHGQNSPPALVLAHSKVINDLAEKNDAIGNPNQIIQGVGPTGRVLAPYGVPIAANDLLVDTTVTPNRYETLLLWPRAIAAWINPVPWIGSLVNPRIPAEETFVHFWSVFHRYKRRDQSPLPGVVIVKSN